MRYIFTPDPYYKNGLIDCLRTLKRGDSLEIPEMTSGGIQTTLKRLRPRSFSCRRYNSLLNQVTRFGVIVTRNWKPCP